MPKKEAVDPVPPLPAHSNCALAQTRNATDYLATASVAAYFDVREKEAYYQSLKHVGPQRDFHERFIEILERFVNLTESASGAAAVDQVIAESLCIQRSTTEPDVGTPLEVAQAWCPTGVELLHLTEPLTFDSLRSAYRLAARQYHPDAGGSHDAMVAINEAFHLTHLLLHAREIGVGTSGALGAAPKDPTEICDCAAYRYKCGEWLFLITLDDWNIDKAFSWLERITSSTWQCSGYARHPWRWMALTAPASKLAIRLSVAGLREQAARALAVARIGLQEAQKQGLSYEPYVREPEEILAGKKHAQVVLNHKRQADNALRLGVINRRRYQTVSERLGRFVSAEAAKEVLLHEFLSGRGFIRDLPTDHPAEGKTPKIHLVPEPGYYVTRIAELADDQQAEYLIAFSDRTTLPLVRKYTFVRLVSLLESVLYFPGYIEDRAAEGETELLASLHDGSGRSYSAEVGLVIAELSQQSLSERRARAELLKDIEQRTAGITAGAGFTVTIAGESPLGMPLSTDYFKVIRLPLYGLRTIQGTERGPCPG